MAYRLLVQPALMSPYVHTCLNIFWRNYMDFLLLTRVYDCAFYAYVMFWMEARCSVSAKFVHTLHFDCPYFGS
jgi:hypothetical protein